MIFAVWLAFIIFLFQLEYLRAKVFLIGAVVFFCVIFFKKIPIRKTDPIIVSFFSWVFILFLSSLLNGVVFTSLIGYGTYRAQGLLFFFLGGVLLYKKEYINNGKSLKILFWLINIFIFASSAFTGGEYVISLGSKQFAGSVLIVIATLVSQKYLLFSIIPIILLGNTSSIGLLVFALIINLLVHLSVSRKVKLMSITIVCLATVLLGRHYVYRGEVSTEDRQTIEGFAVQAILKKPLIGYGAENTTEIFNSYYKKANLNLEGLVVDRSHNIILDVLLWSGVLGLVTFLSFLFFLLRKLWREKRQKQIVALLTVLLYSLFQPLSAVHWLILFVFIA